MERSGLEEVKSILLLSLFAILLLEPFDPSGCIQEFLFSGKERMTAGTYLHMDLFLGTLRLKSRTTGTFDERIKNFRMGILFHLSLQTSILLIFHPFSTFFGNCVMVTGDRVGLKN